MARPVGLLIELRFYAPKKEARNFALQRQFLCHGFLKKRDALSGQTGKGQSGLFGAYGSYQDSSEPSVLPSFCVLGLSVVDIF